MHPALAQLFKADLAIILGSGIGFKIPGSERIEQISYADLPGQLPAISVQGHAGYIECFRYQNLKFLCFKGRFHLYEGKSVHEVQSIVRLIKSLAIERLLLFNAAGGVSPKLSVGDLVLLDGIKNLQIPDSRGLLSNLTAPVLSIDSPLKRLISASSELKTGIYAALLGPNYETHLEIRLLRQLGCSAVGMSTYLEVLAAQELGLDCAAVSLITNSWNLTSDGYPFCKPSHDEVLQSASKAELEVKKLVSFLLKEISKKDV